MRSVPPSPPAAPKEAVTGMSCPECMGVLRVSTEGRERRLRFRCRVGHLYSLEDVIVGKERRIEEHLWAATTALNELATLLTEVGASRPKGVARAFRERTKLAGRQQATLRRVLDENQPTAFEQSGSARKR